ncbi:hypothetical protein CROQUDRAFT_74312 [Cronartium quercuum f. sp. fusiforme G11]|uniref:Flavin-containing monooxygenase n=1 Tax=Cronartium quercuum f. sp. fusiforme G11 TaxID=708437 RepID=A0A9P6NNU4_9BASI|nr:hypothetical protein CROQUDRAFT_74312 [Cronartium quercuum f. sp. fusiforme G11]
MSDDDDGLQYDQTDVLIIGAGASGLAALRQLSSTTSFKLRCFDSRTGVGGLWNYEPEPGPCNITFDSHGHPHISNPPRSITPIYAGLRTNVATDLMAFHQLPFQTGLTSFPSHSHVLEYLQRAASGLESYLQLGTEVRRVRYRPDDHPTDRRWVVEIEELKLSLTRLVYCDFVIAANGHNSQAYIPSIPGLSTWPNPLLHTLFYRNPIYHSKTIAVVGLGPSGYDLLRELACLPLEIRPKLYALSAHPPKLGWDLTDPSAPEWTRHIITRPSLASVSELILTLSDNSTINDVDLLFFATGYSYDFPFTHSSDLPWSETPLTSSGRRVHHLDQFQTFYFPDPSFAHLALNTSVVPFPLAEHQARAIAALWSGRVKVDLRPFEDEITESNSVHVLIPVRFFRYSFHIFFDLRLLKSVREKKNSQKNTNVRMNF